MKLKYKQLFSGGRDSDHYSTPVDFYNKLDKEFHFTFDPCPLKCTEFDGLQIPWRGYIFCNPPYSDVGNWLNKGINEIKAGNCKKAVFLIPLRTDALYWHDEILNFAAEIRLVKGRLTFGNKKDVAPFPVALVIFDTYLRGNSKLLSYMK